MALIVRSYFKIARAICEAASRPDMRFVRVKSEEQQAALMQRTSRQLLIDQRTAVANSLRGQLAEFGGESKYSAMVEAKSRRYRKGSCVKRGCASSSLPDLYTKCDVN